MTNDVQELNYFDEEVNVEDDVLQEDNNIVVYEFNSPDYSIYLNSLDENVTILTEFTTTVNDFYSRLIYLNEFIVFQFFIITILLITLIFRGVKK